MSKILMTTFSGRRIDPYEFIADDIVIEDIAHSLALLCRFGGHTKEFYSVAQHSVRVARSVAPELMLEGLLHDAPEAYIQDLVRPVKRRNHSYVQLEKLIWRSFAFKYGFGEGLSFEVVRADDAALKSELQQFMGDPAQELSEPYWNRITELPPVDYAWSPGEAEGHFLMTYVEAIAARAAYIKAGGLKCYACQQDLCTPKCPFHKMIGEVH